MINSEIVVSCLLDNNYQFLVGEVGILQKKNKIKILTVLYKNAQKNHPQVVSSTSIADQLDMNLTELQKVLRSMRGTGVIETDPDLRFSLITREGLAWLNHQDSGDLNYFG